MPRPGKSFSNDRQWRSRRGKAGGCPPCHGTGRLRLAFPGFERCSHGSEPPREGGQSLILARSTAGNRHYRDSAIEFRHFV